MKNKLDQIMKQMFIGKKKENDNMNNDCKYKFDDEGGRYLDKQYFDWNEMLSYTAKKYIDKYALPTPNNEFRSQNYPSWKFDSMFNKHKTYDIKNIVWKVSMHIDKETNEIVNNFIEPCIVYKDNRKSFDQYFVESVSMKVLENIKERYPKLMHLEINPIVDDRLTILEKKDNFYVTADKIYPPTRTSLYVKVFGIYEMANSYRYNKYIELKNNLEDQEYVKKTVEAMDVVEGNKVITLSEIAKAFNCDKNKIVLDLSK